MALATLAALRTTRITCIKTAMETGASAAATIDFRSGAAAGIGNADTGTLAGTITCVAGTGATTVSGAVLTLAGTPLSVTVANSCTMAHFRINDRNAAAVIEGTVGTSGSDINFSGGVAVLAGGTLTLSSLTITEAA